MGYETTLHLVDITIDPSRRAIVEELIHRERKAKNSPLAYCLRLLDFDSSGFLEFRRKKLPLPGASELADEEGFVLTAVGKWAMSGKLAEWLCRNDFEGAVIEHSRECDGEAWGWEFKRRRIRRLKLKPSSPWRRPK
jgi:hypothetical protein